MAYRCQSFYFIVDGGEVSVTDRRNHGRVAAVHTGNRWPEQGLGGAAAWSASTDLSAGKSNFYQPGHVRQPYRAAVSKSLEATARQGSRAGGAGRKTRADSTRFVSRTTRGVVGVSRVSTRSAFLSGACPRRRLACPGDGVADVPFGKTQLDELLAPRIGDRDPLDAGLTRCSRGSKGHPAPVRTRLVVGLAIESYRVYPILSCLDKPG